MTDTALPARYNLQIWESNTFRKTVTLLTGGPTSHPRDLSGFTSSLTVRTAPLAPVIYTLSTGNGKITLGGAAGTIQLYIPSSDTTQAFFPPSGGVYELAITAPGPGDTVTLMWGTVQLKGISG